MVRSAVLLSSSLPSLDLFDLTLSTFPPSTTINDIWLFKVVYCNTFIVFCHLFFQSLTACGLQTFLVSDNKDTDDKDYMNL